MSNVRTWKDKKGWVFNIAVEQLKGFNKMFFVQVERTDGTVKRYDRIPRCDDYKTLVKNTEAYAKKHGWQAV